MINLFEKRFKICIQLFAILLLFTKNQYFNRISINIEYCF